MFFDTHGNTSTYVLTGSNELTCSGNNNMCFINGGVDKITNVGNEMTVDILAAGGVVTVTGFKGVIGLDPSFGFANARDALHHVVSDGHGGSLLAFKGGSVDLVGVAPTALKAGNFHIDGFHFAPF